MYTLLELQAKTFGELKKIGDELNVLPKGDRRCRQSWIDAIAGVNPPLLALLEVSPAGEVPAEEPIMETVENSPGVEVDRVSEPIGPMAETSPGVEGDPVSELESKFGRIVYPRPAAKIEPKLSHGAITQAAKKAPGSSKSSTAHQLLELFKSRAHITEAVSESTIGSARNSTGIPLSDKFCSSYSPPQSENILFHSKTDGQLSLLDFEVQTQPEPPDPDDFESIEEFREAIARWDREHPELAASSDSMRDLSASVQATKYPRNARRDCPRCVGVQSLYNDRNCILEEWVIRCLYCDYERLKDPRSAYLRREYPIHGPDEYPWFKEAFRQASAFQAPSIRRYAPPGENCCTWAPLPTEPPPDPPSDSELVQEAITPATKTSPGVENENELPTKNDAATGTVCRASATSVPPGGDLRPEHNGASSDRQDERLAGQKGHRLLEKKGFDSGDTGQFVSHQPAKLAPQAPAQPTEKSPGGGCESEFKIGMLVGRRRDLQHLGKILAIYKSRRGIWRAKIQPLNKSNFAYFDCATLVEQRLLYDYEMGPGGFVRTGKTIFNKARWEHFEVFSRKVRSPKPTNWTAGELSSLSTFKLKQIARDMEIPSIPGTAGKRSIIRAILAEQVISQEKAAAQREQETGRAIVQKRTTPTAGKKNRAAASPLGNQLSLFDVAV